MPERPKRPCAAPGCPALVDTGYCPRHTKNAEQFRGTAASRGYDSQWRRFRALVLSKPDNAVCRDCKRRASTDLHHIKKVQDYPELKLVEENTMAICGPCHSRRTKAGE